MNPVDIYINQKLQERTEAGNLRTLKTQRAQVDFFSNDYLGWATNNVLRSASAGTGSTGSRLLSGNSAEMEALESTIAKFHHAEAALLFNSGYDANTGLLSALANRHTTVLYDELCHASIIDGVRLSLAPRQYKFRHNDTNDLARKLEQFATAGPVIVVAESVYSMDGDTAPLKEIASLAHQYHAAFIVDEAHATGVFGENGAGLVSAENLEQYVFARVHTFGKALGCHGAAVAGSNRLKQFLVNFARPFIYTTALPAHSIDTISNAYDHLLNSGHTNQQLHELIAYFRQQVVNWGGGWKDSASPIQALILGSNSKALAAAAALQQAGLQVNAILHPTVAKGEERLRVCLHSFNTREQVDLLFHTLKSAT